MRRSFKRGSSPVPWGGTTKARTRCSRHRTTTPASSGLIRLDSPSYRPCVPQRPAPLATGSRAYGTLRNSSDCTISIGNGRDSPGCVDIASTFKEAPGRCPSNYPTRRVAYRFPKEKVVNLDLPCGRTSQTIPKCVPHMRRSPASVYESSDHSSGRLVYLEYDSEFFLFAKVDVTRATPRIAAQHRKAGATERNSRQSLLPSPQPRELRAFHDPCGQESPAPLTFPREAPRLRALRLRRDGAPA